MINVKIIYHKLCKSSVYIYIYINKNNHPHDFASEDLVAILKFERAKKKKGSFFFVTIKKGTIYQNSGGN